MTGNPIYILFFAVYGVDSVLTIIQRLLRRENIFKAHRTHLYQYLANEAGGNRLMIAYSYGLLQVGVGLAVFKLAACPTDVQLWGSLGILVSLGLVYLLLKRYVLLRYA